MPMMTKAAQQGGAPGLLLVCGLCICMIGAALGRRAADEAIRKQQKSEQIAMQALKAALAVRDRVAALDRELRGVDKARSGAEAALTAARTEADRVAAQNRLDELRIQRFEMERRIQNGNEHVFTCGGAPHLSKECLDNPLAKSCD
jgi:hypothetical protein